MQCLVRGGHIHIHRETNNDQPTLLCRALGWEHWQLPLHCPNFKFVSQHHAPDPSPFAASILSHLLPPLPSTSPLSFSPTPINVFFLGDIPTMGRDEFWKGELMRKAAALHTSNETLFSQQGEGLYRIPLLLARLFSLSLQGATRRREGGRETLPNATHRQTRPPPRPSIFLSQLVLLSPSHLSLPSSFSFSDETRLL